jgi:chemosensory pili system protein ChpC
MSRTAVKKDTKQQSSTEDQVVRCLLLPQKNSTLLLPNTTVAEVTDYSPPVTTDHSPDWLLGLLSWRGRNIPLVSFENFFREELSQETPRQVAVLNSLNGNPGVPFIAITISSLPRLVHLTASSVEYIDGGAKKDDPEVILARMNFSGEYVVIPNIDYIEDRIVQLGIQ